MFRDYFQGQQNETTAFVVRNISLLEQELNYISQMSGDRYDIRATSETHDNLPIVYIVRSNEFEEKFPVILHITDNGAESKPDERFGLMMEFHYAQITADISFPTKINQIAAKLPEVLGLEQLALESYEFEATEQQRLSREEQAQRAWEDQNYPTTLDLPASEIFDHAAARTDFDSFMDELNGDSPEQIAQSIFSMRPTRDTRPCPQNTRRTGSVFSSIFGRPRFA